MNLFYIYTNIVYLGEHDIIKRIVVQLMRTGDNEIVIVT